VISPDAQFLVMLIWGLITPAGPLLPTVGFIVTSIIVAVVSRGSFHRQTVALLCVLGIMSFQSFGLIMLELYVHVLMAPSGVFLPIPGGMPNYLSTLFEANLWLAGLGVAGAAFVAVCVCFGKSRLEMLHTSREAALIQSPMWLREIVLGLAARAKVSCPELCLVDSGTPQAFTVRAKSKYVVALTVGMLECFDSKEVEACIAHEIAHIKNSDFTIRFLATLGKVAVFSKPMSYLVEAAIYRAREFLADKTAASLIGGPDALISALTKLGELNSQSSIPTAASPVCACFSGRTEGVRRILDKHPALESRITLLTELKTPSARGLVRDLHEQKSCQPFPRIKLRVPTARSVVEPRVPPQISGFTNSDSDRHSQGHGNDLTLGLEVN
jgi:heat shock protein HtpX